MEIPLQVFAFVWGACWGSFLNVVIHRLPLEESVVTPGSRCGSCKIPIRWYDNIPILSYLLLRGRCRRCHTRFSPRYMLVEAACGVFTLYLLRSLVLPLDAEGLPWDMANWLWWQIFIYALVAVTFIDLEHTFIPWEITLPAGIIGLAGGFFLPDHDGLSELWGALGGAGFLLAIIGLGWVLFKREAMGLGDVHLLAMIGAFLGWRALPFVVFASAVQALLAALVAFLWAKFTGSERGLLVTTTQLDEKWGEEDRFAGQKERLALPYGPFLALAALEAMVFGGDLFWEFANLLARMMHG